MDTVSCLCYGKTWRGRRCKLKTLGREKCYGVEFPVCRHHKTQNVIYKWSLSTTSLNIPEKIRSFLTFYNYCVGIKVNHWVALVMTAELYTKIDVREYTKDELVQAFWTAVFTNCSGDCSICYESGECIKTRCGHVFCSTCMHHWTSSNVSCPMCRKIISSV
jgi:hypothetical protein